MRDNLVIVRAGDNSLHESWLAGTGTRNWDLWVNYFGDDPERFRGSDCTRLDSKGPKWPALHVLITAHLPEIGRYKYVWLPDDDVDCDLNSVNSLFDICRRYGLDLAQPALAAKGYSSHLITICCPNFTLRFTNFVEIMVPCFSAGFLARCLPTFAQNLSGWGLDFLWPHWASGNTKVAIIDAVTVTHTRPVGGPNYKFLAAHGVTPDQEGKALVEKYGVRAGPKWVSGGITRTGERLSVFDGTHGRLVGMLVIGYGPYTASMPNAVVDLLAPSLAYLPPLRRTRDRAGRGSGR